MLSGSGRQQLKKFNAVASGPKNISEGCDQVFMTPSTNVRPGQRLIESSCPEPVRVAKLLSAAAKYVCPESNLCVQTLIRLRNVCVQNLPVQNLHGDRREPVSEAGWMAGEPGHRSCLGRPMLAGRVLRRVLVPDGKREGKAGKRGQYQTEPQATAALAMLPHPDALQGGRVDHFARPSVCSPLPAKNTVCCCVLFTVGERSGTSALLFCVRCLHYASKPSKFRTNGRSRGARLRWRWVHRLELR
jgi:hypothetical protein